MKQSLNPGEYMRIRRERRLRRNLDCRPDVETWAAQRGFSLRVNNDGHHWIFQRDRFVAEWWPSSSKLVLNRNYLHGRHVHDWQQVIKELERASESKPANISPSPTP